MEVTVASQPLRVAMRGVCMPVFIFSARLSSGVYESLSSGCRRAGGSDVHEREETISARGKERFRHAGGSDRGPVVVGGRRR